VTTVLGGGSCQSGAISAALSKAITPLTTGEKFEVRLIVQSAIGGTASTLGGGKFGNGAVTAAFGYLFNEVQHSAAEARAKYGKGTVGHHWVPFGSTTDLDISPEARAFWGQSTNGMSLPDSVHLPQHGAYNTAVRAELLDWSAKNNVDLATMSADDAKRFTLHVQGSQHPDIARIVGRVNHYHGMSVSTRSAYRFASSLGLVGAAEAFYPSPMRAPQCQISPSTPGC
jgi:hypothetical protein